MIVFYLERGVIVVAGSQDTVPRWRTALASLLLQLAKCELLELEWGTMAYMEPSRMWQSLLKVSCDFDML